MVSYRGDLPSLHLEPEELKDLEEVMKRHLSSAETQVQVGSGGFNRSFDSVNELMEDSSIPPHILEFKILVRGEEGKCMIQTDSSGISSMFNSIRISGDEDWVKTKKTDLEEFFEHNSNSIRTLTGKMSTLFPICIILSFITTLPVYLLVDVRWAFRSFILIFNIYWIFGLFGLNYVYPYTMITTKKNKYFRPYIRRVVVWIAGLIGVIAGGLTIMDYFT